ncbi:MAG TPA: hypothetical protein VM692_10385 [Gammaproteobacteria bacterium]|nr:hypothetical protein [Gammaproteobacteria bacterium]
MAAGDDTRRVREGAPKKRAASGESAGASDVDSERFRLLSITATRTPAGCSGHDWLVYRIAQGENIITGYRQGDLKTASAEVDAIVTSLNERRRSTKTKPGRKAGGAAAAAQPKEQEPPE